MATLPPSKRSLLDLPIEIQRSIVRYTPTKALLSLALVNHHFHSLACAKLYKIFWVVVPDDGDTSRARIERLAGPLDTFVTSEHNFSSYLKMLYFDSADGGGGRGEPSYQALSFKRSGGRFLNTLLLLVLRKAEALDTFFWNIRIELSRPLFRALHQIRSLQYLTIRLQPGPSLHKSSAQGPQTTPSTEQIRPSDTDVVTGAPTFAGFKSLRTLAILDMDTLDYLPEIATCIRASSSTLGDLKLSFSDSLAMKARRPTVEDSDDSEDEEVDEFGNTILATSPAALISSTDSPFDKEAALLAEKARQETVLAKIFGVEKRKAVAPVARKREVTGKAPKDKPFVHSAAHEEYLASVKEAASKFVRSRLPVDAQLNKKVRETKEKLVDVYVTNALAAAQPVTLEALIKDFHKFPNEQKDENDHSTNGKEKGKGKEGEREAQAQPSSREGSGQPSPSDATLVENFPSGKETDSVAEAIDMDHPDSYDAADFDEDAVEDHAISASSARVKEDHESSSQQATGEQARDSSNNNELTGESAPAAENTVSPKSETDTKETAQQSTSILEESPSAKAIKDYVLSTRKMALNALSIYLIPLKASVISRAIDLSNLRFLTLLNVGNQQPFWMTMQTIQNKQPLSLHSISTDNVTPIFLTVVRSLKSLRELFLLERNTKNRVESLAGKTTVGIVDIRRRVLRKHIKTLERLMIKNENDYSWDIDLRTMLLLTSHGEKLIELAVSMGIRTFHLLLQYLPGLHSLRALHLSSFRTDDTCTWVMRELRKFATDNVAHHPHLKLEYIGLNDTVERLVRVPKRTVKPPLLSKKAHKKLVAEGAAMYAILKERMAATSTSHGEAASQASQDAVDQSEPRINPSFPLLSLANTPSLPSFEFATVVPLVATLEKLLLSTPAQWAALVASDDVAAKFQDCLKSGASLKPPPDGSPGDVDGSAVVQGSAADGAHPRSEDDENNDDEDSDEEEDEDEDGQEGALPKGPVMKVETIEGVAFADVPSVRIFRKDVRLGRL